MEPLITAKEASEILRCSLAKINRFAREKKIISTKMGKTYLFKESNIEMFLSANSK